jgi:hypothetical protein
MKREGSYDMGRGRKKDSDVVAELKLLRKEVGKGLGAVSLLLLPSFMYYLIQLLRLYHDYG